MNFGIKLGKTMRINYSKSQQMVMSPLQFSIIRITTCDYNIHMWTPCTPQMQFENIYLHIPSMYQTKWRIWMRFSVVFFLLHVFNRTDLRYTLERITDVTSPMIHTDIIIIIVLFKKEWRKRKGAQHGRDITHSIITMIHCVVSAAALWQWLSISFIWHFIAVRSQQPSVMLWGGHSPRVHGEGCKREPGDGGGGGGRGLEGGGGSTSGKHCWGKVRVWEGGMRRKETTTAKASPSDAEPGLSSPSQGFPSHFPSPHTRHF